MVDLHAHVLPGLDDGPRTMEEAVILVGEAVAAGITTIVASPHAFNGLYRNPSEVVRSAVVALRASLVAAGHQVRVLPGMEIFPTPDLPADLAGGRAMGMNDSKYVLLELPSLLLPRYLETVLFTLRVDGYVPVINHPERNVVIQRTPSVFAGWVRDGGCLGAVTGASLRGWFGRRVQSCAERLVGEGLIHAVVSDAHPGVGREYGPAMAEVMRNTNVVVSGLFRAVEEGTG
jgi:protein-tyrosine phosphatase